MKGRIGETGKGRRVRSVIGGKQKAESEKKFKAESSVSPILPFIGFLSPGW
jgi:hypothetical protein